jgi:hypothetical protein
MLDSYSILSFLRPFHQKCRKSKPDERIKAGRTDKEVRIAYQKREKNMADRKWVKNRVVPGKKKRMNLKSFEHLFYCQNVDFFALGFSFLTARDEKIII